MPRVAINLVTWNSEKSIGATLESLAGQTCTDTSVTVIDNASTDGTLDILHDWEARGVKVICNPVNEGFARAHNTAIRHTDSEYVLLVNPDIILSETFVDEMVCAASSELEIGSVSGRLLQIDPDELQASLAEQGRLLDSAGLAMSRSRRQRLRGFQQDTASHYSHSAHIFGPDGAAPLYRRAMLEDVQIEGEIFDETFHTHKEDVDLAWRAQLLGWKSVYAPAAIAYHVRSFRPGQRDNMPPHVKRIAVRNRWLMIVKNDLPWLFARHLPWIAAYEVGMLAYALVFERTSLPAWADFFRLAPTALRRRRLIQQRRRVGWRYMQQWFS